jgi:hypothetical protein
MMLAFTIQPSLQIYLPAGDDNTSLLNLTVQIRDLLNCVKDFFMDPIVVTLDQKSIDTFVDFIQNPNNGSTNNAIVQALTSGNQNIVGPKVTSLSQEFNKKNKQNLEKAIASMYTIDYLLDNLE